MRDTRFSVGAPSQISVVWQWNKLHKHWREAEVGLRRYS